MDLAMDMRQPTERENSGSENELNGIQVQMNTNTAELRNKLMTEEKTEASVCLLKKPSQAKAPSFLPASASMRCPR